MAEHVKADCEASIIEHSYNQLRPLELYTLFSIKALMAHDY